MSNTTRSNAFAAQMQAALNAQIAADRAFTAGDAATGQAEMLNAHAATSAAAAEAETADVSRGEG